MPKNYEIEREGQIAFFHNFRIDYEKYPVLIDNTDGVWKGNILEFKLNVSNLNKVVFQTIKYLSKMRIKGESIPANILIVDLNQEICYLYHSQDYFDDIHKVYIGSASTNNENFIAKNYKEKIDYSTQEGSFRLLQLLQENNFMKIKIDENCVVGWSERYYRENPTAKKGDFLGDDTGKIKIKGEIREPKHFKDYILPFNDTTNERFKFLMDILNDKLSKKDLGAFYTPMPYAKKACELVKMAIDKVPEGNDYIILDRCCGTGNLEQAILEELGEEVATHIICSTYEYYEYKVLVERLGDKVRTIIPPTEENIIYDKGCVLNADALSKDYVDNPIIKSYIDNPKCSIILFENPPYSEAGSIQYITDENYKQVAFKNSYLFEEFSKDIKGTARNEMSNLFIWSAFKYYLRQDTDSYIVFSPIKYWKTQKVISKKHIKSFIFNRKHFHASTSAVMCIYWENKDDPATEFKSEIYDIQNDKLLYIKDFEIKRVNKPLSNLYDKRSFTDDVKGIVCSMDGTEAHERKVRINPIDNDNIIGYLITQSFGFENPRLATNLLRLPIYNGNGFYLRKDNYLNKLPLFCAGKYYIEDNWFENGIVCKTSDAGEKYINDKDFLKSCLMFTGLSYYNKCLSFRGSNGKTYTNELCFDTGTLALDELNKLELNQDEEDLMGLWNKILLQIKDYPEYNPNYKYGTYQVTKEINTYTEVKNGKKIEKRYDHPDLNGDLNTLRIKLKDYYNKYISKKMFEYELLK